MTREPVSWFLASTVNLKSKCFDPRHTLCQLALWTHGHTHQLAVVRCSQCCSPLLYCNLHNSVPVLASGHCRSEPVHESHLQDNSTVQHHIQYQWPVHTHSGKTAPILASEYHHSLAYMESIPDSSKTWGNCWSSLVRVLLFLLPLHQGWLLYRVGSLCHWGRGYSLDGRSRSWWRCWCSVTRGSQGGCTVCSLFPLDCESVATGVLCRGVGAIHSHLYLSNLFCNGPPIATISDN